MHEGKKSHKYNNCDVSFANYHDLKKHVSAVHEKRSLTYTKHVELVLPDTS